MGLRYSGVPRGGNMSHLVDHADKEVVLRHTGRLDRHVILQDLALENEALPGRLHAGIHLLELCLDIGHLSVMIGKGSGQMHHFHSDAWKWARRSLPDSP